VNERIKELISQPGLERLNDWASIGPVQRAALDEFTELVVLECARVVKASSQGRDVVAWRFWSGDWQYVCDKRMLHHLTDDVFVEPLFLAPNKWQGLTDDELREILGYGKIERSPTRDFDFVDVIDVKLTRSLINAIEAKLKAKNGG